MNIIHLADKGTKWYLQKKNFNQHWNAILQLISAAFFLERSGLEKYNMAWTAQKKEKKLLQTTSSGNLGPNMWRLSPVIMDCSPFVQ